MQERVQISPYQVNGLERNDGLSHLTSHEVHP